MIKSNLTSLPRQSGTLKIISNKGDNTMDEVKKKDEVIFRVSTEEFKEEEE